MSKGWRTCVYAFFGPVPKIKYREGRKCHVFQCSAKNCKHGIARYLDTKDAQSTGNMRKHVRKCWGEDVLKAADQARDVKEARENVVGSYVKNGSITAAFERKSKVIAVYSHRQHTKTETR
jgi:hypothetical protein